MSNSFLKKLSKLLFISMERYETAYIMKLGGQLLTHTARSSPHEVFDNFKEMLPAGGKVVEVEVVEVDERPVFWPTAYVFSSPDKDVFWGSIDPDEGVSQPEKVAANCPVIDRLKRATGIKAFACDMMYLFEMDSDGDNFSIRNIMSFAVTENGDSTSVSRLVQKNELQQVITKFLKRFNY